MAKVRADIYPNRAIFHVSQTTANDLSFQQVRFGMGIFTGTALILQRVEWFPDQAWNDSMVVAADFTEFAMTNRDDLAELEGDNMNVLLLKQHKIFVSGTPATAFLNELPIISDYSGLPGGGLIFPANPLFIAIHTTGFTSAITLKAVMYYLTKQLTDADYIELVQSLIPVNI